MLQLRDAESGYPGMLYFSMFFSFKQVSLKTLKVIVIVNNILNSLKFILKI